MPMLVINADLKRVAEALERIADVVEKLVPQQTFDPSKLDMATIDYVAGDPPPKEDLWRDYGPRNDYR